MSGLCCISHAPGQDYDDESRAGVHFTQSRHKVASIELTLALETSFNSRALGAQEPI